jgi:glutamate synthase (NADPH/NADH) small chain
VARDWSVQTRRAIARDDKLTGLECVRVEWKLGDGGKMNLVEVPGSEFVLEAGLVLLAMGFTGPRKQGLVEQAGVALDARGNVKADTLSYKTSAAKIFSCGDMRRGQSLVVWAIREGRQCARGVDEFLMGSSELPR